MNAFVKERNGLNAGDEPLCDYNAKDQGDKKDSNQDDTPEIDETLQKHVTFDILSPVPLANESINRYQFEPINSIRDAENVPGDHDIGDDFYDNMEGMAIYFLFYLLYITSMVATLSVMNCNTL